jgi:hypothetical protein
MKRKPNINAVLFAANENLQQEVRLLRTAVVPLIEEILLRKPYRRSELYRLAVEIDENFRLSARIRRIRTGQ